VLRRLAPVLVLVACVAVIVAFQVTRPSQVESRPDVFVPSPGFYLDFSPSFRTSIADAYWLYTIQYYGEHTKTDQRYDALPALLDLVTSLSPRFSRAYLFGSYALLDAGLPQEGYDLLVRGAEANPDDWRLPANAGIFVYTFGDPATKARDAAEWYERAAAVPGRPGYVPRLAAALLAKGGEQEKAILMWAQVYADGDKYSREKAVAALDELLPEGKEERMEAVAPLAGTMPEATFEELLAALFDDYL
jgi:tetratricopeptide (TPR) repeat protein